MGFDVDDVGAVCVANALADNNEAEIILVVHNTGLLGLASMTTSGIHRRSALTISIAHILYINIRMYVSVCFALFSGGIHHTNGI